MTHYGKITKYNYLKTKNSFGKKNKDIRKRKGKRF